MTTKDQEPIFQGWLAHSKSAATGQMTWSPFQPKPFTQNDVDIKITHCGICGSDIHTLRSGWGNTSYPCIVGHEIVGHATRVGNNIPSIKTGDRVGVGAQSSSCGKPDCEMCSIGEENYCNKMIGTYNSKYEDGSKSYGGYANFARVPGRFVFKVPKGLESKYVAPLLCGGITVYSPLVRNGAGPGKKVGIVGLGGLGHFGVLFARALGCEKITAISRGNGKREDALKLGADHYIATGEEEGWHKKNYGTLDLIVCTVSDSSMPLARYLALLRPFGTFIQVGAPEDRLPSMSAFPFISKGIKLGGSQIGSPKEIVEMLKFAEEKGIKPWVQERRMGDANEAIVDFEKGLPRYRFVLVAEKEGPRL